MERIEIWFRYCIFEPIQLFFIKLQSFFKNLWYYRKMLWRDRDYDYAYLLRLEQLKLKKMSERIRGYGDSKRMGQLLQTCVRLIDIIIDGDTPDTDNVVYINDRNFMRYWPAYRDIENEIINDSEIREKKQHLLYIKCDLRTEKAFVLYHKIRQAYLRKWWC